MNNISISIRSAILIVSCNLGVPSGISPGRWAAIVKHVTREYIQKETARA